MTPLEGIGLVLLLIGGGGLGILLYDAFTEYGKPAHNHPEGQGGYDCPRCGGAA